METIDSSQYVSEYTKKTLAQFDWEPGDPIPLNMSEMLAEIYERTPKSATPGLYLDSQKMTEADITAVKTMLAKAKAAVKQTELKAKVDAATAGLGESTRALYEQLATQSEIIDDRAAAAEPAPEPVQEPPPPKDDDAIKVTPPEPLPPVAEPCPAFCPRCSWNMQNEFNVQITDEDKENFVAITLGGERFRKTFSILNGKFKVQFRSLLAEENSQIHHQLLLDQKNDPSQFLSDTEWFLRLFEYRLGCSIASVTADGKQIAQVPELDEITEKTELPNKTDDPEKTPIQRLRNYVVVQILKSEVVRRLVSNEFREFQRLCEALEAMAVEPNFW